jgi:hypothetical protein
MPPAGFETAIPASERLLTHAIDHAVTGIGNTVRYFWELLHIFVEFQDKKGQLLKLLFPVEH